MKSFETYTQTKIATGLAIAIGALGVAGCGSPADNGGQKDQEQSVNEGITAKYFKDGTRLIEYSGTDTYQPIYEFCDGPDLVEQLRNSGIDRSVDHPACADGRLTPEDFKLPTTPEN